MSTCQAINDWFSISASFNDLDQLLKPCKFLLFTVKVAHRELGGLMGLKLMHLLIKKSEKCHFLTKNRYAPP